MAPIRMHAFEAFKIGCREGDEHYFRQESSNLFNYLLGKTENRAVAQDLANKVFKFCFANRQLFHDEAELIAGFFAIGRGFYEGFRLGQRERGDDSDDLNTPGKGLSVYDDADYARTEIIAALRRSFCQLSARRRRVLVCYYRRAMNTRQIAEKLKIKTQTALNHKAQALARLKKDFGPNWDKILPLLYS